MLWLDDIRPSPQGWTWCRSVNEAIALSSQAVITHMSLDHDLGVFAHDGGDGAKFTDWLADPANRWPTGGIRVHSRNGVGVRTMLATVDRYSEFALGYGDSRGSSPEGGWPAALM